MEILFFTEEQKELINSYFLDYKFPKHSRWELIKTPEGWFLPAKILQDENMLLKILNLGAELKSVPIREFEESDKIKTIIPENK